MRRRLFVVVLAALVFALPTEARRKKAAATTEPGTYQKGFIFLVPRHRRRRAAEVPPEARVIDVEGAWVLPGLADMHVHLENARLLRLYGKEPNIPTGTVRTEDALLPYVANGVLQIAVLSAMPETIAQRIEVETGRVLGPHIALAAMIDGTPVARVVAGGAP